MRHTEEGKRLMQHKFTLYLVLSLSSGRVDDGY